MGAIEMDAIEAIRRYHEHPGEVSRSAYRDAIATLEAAYDRTNNGIGGVWWGPQMAEVVSMLTGFDARYDADSYMGVMTDVDRGASRPYNISISDVLWALRSTPPGDRIRFVFELGGAYWMD